MVSGVENITEFTSTTNLIPLNSYSLKSIQDQVSQSIIVSQQSSQITLAQNTPESLIFASISQSLKSLSIASPSSLRSYHSGSEYTNVFEKNTTIYTVEISTSTIKYNQEKSNESASKSIVNLETLSSTEYFKISSYSSSFDTSSFFSIFSPTILFTDSVIKFTPLSYSATSSFLSTEIYKTFTLSSKFLSTPFLSQFIEHLDSENTTTPFKTTLTENPKSKSSITSLTSKTSISFLSKSKGTLDSNYY